MRNSTLRFAVALAGSSLLFSSTALAATYEVCADPGVCAYQTLESAWLGVPSGSTIYVHDGRWTPGGLPLRSAGDITIEGASTQGTVIACNGSGYLSATANNGTFTLSFKTLTWETCTSGGGIGTPTGVTLRFDNVHVKGAGGRRAVFSAGSAGYVRSSLFTPLDGELLSNGGYLGGIGHWDVADSTFIGADTRGISYAHGGAIDVNYSGVTVKRSTFIDNHADVGGAIAINGSPNWALTYVVDDNYFCGNTARLGGAVHMGGGPQLPLNRNVFYQNHADEYGGAYYVGNYSITLDHNTFVDNHAGVGGAALFANWVTSQRVDRFSNNLFALHAGPAATAEAFTGGPFSGYSQPTNQGWFDNGLDMLAPGWGASPADVTSGPVFHYGEPDPNAGCDADLRLTSLSQMAGGGTGGSNIGALPATPEPVVDADGDGANATIDCDDNDPQRFPGNPELCNDVDDDCNDLVDDTPVDGTPYFRDVDLDGFGVQTDVVVACARPAGRVTRPGDCDDRDSDVFPGAPEVCNGVDDDCDPATQEDAGPDALDWYADVDGDTYGDASASRRACVNPPGYVAEALDCDDHAPTTHPRAPELCNGVDDDCDPTTSEDDGPEALTWFADADADGFGDALASARACALPPGHVADASDCDDHADTTSPGAAERCDGVDDDCDPTTSEDDGPFASAWYADADGDSFGDPSDRATACAAPLGRVADASDCDDASPAVNPRAVEVCNGVDDDCNPATVEPRSPFAYDADADGYAADRTVSYACADAPPAGGVPLDQLVATALDCDDAAAAVNPAAPELCNGVDDDCDGVVDGDHALDVQDFYYDGDGDGWGVASGRVRRCAPRPGEVPVAGDCDDGSRRRHPGALELCNGLDDDCDGQVDQRSAEDPQGVCGPAVDAGTEAPSEVEVVATKGIGGSGGCSSAGGGPRSGAALGLLSLLALALRRRR